MWFKEWITEILGWEKGVRAGGGFWRGVVWQEWAWFLQVKGDGMQSVFLFLFFFLKVVILKGEEGLSSYSLKAN